MSDGFEFQQCQGPVSFFFLHHGLARLLRRNIVRDVCKADRGCHTKAQHADSVSRLNDSKVIDKDAAP